MSDFELKLGIAETEINILKEENAKQAERIKELEQELTDVKSNYNCRCSHKACRVCEQRESINKVLGIGGDV